MASDAVCDTPAFVSSAAELPFEEPVAESIAEDMLAVTDSVREGLLVDVEVEVEVEGVWEGLEGRDGMAVVGWAMIKGRLLLE